MLRLLIILASAIALSCKRTPPDTVVPAPESSGQTENQPAPKTNTAVIAGQSIGNISLGMDARDLDAILGPPDLSDSAMGKSWLTWYSDRSGKISGKSELNIFTAYENAQMQRKVVRLIRVTSADFGIAGIASGASFSDIKHRFPDIANAGSYALHDAKEAVELYDDEPNGIAFEFRNGLCIALLVHPRDNDMMLDYRLFRPEMALR